MEQAAEGQGSTLRTIVYRTTELTPLKAVAARAIQMAEDEHSAAMDLATVLSSDQALTAKLLKLSNSAYYGYSRRIGTVREAVILLGMRTVRSVAIASSIIEAFEVAPIRGFSRDLFWAHSVCVGLVAESMAKSTKAARPEDAFTAGVMHDVGKLAMLLTYPELFGQATRLVVDDGWNWRDAEREVFGVRHQDVGARLAQRWKFPDNLVEAIRNHHPERMPSTVETLDDVIATSNLACNRHGLACGFDWKRAPDRQPTETIPPMADQALDRVHGGMRTLEDRARAFMLNVSTRPPAWYAPGPHDNDDNEDPGTDESHDAVA
ncbi:MAG: HDOD domain-containing protein [Dehalococcoidia bacterium]|nr:HDOD domain-containing protein [Dehalococcoidia bacterium]